MKINAIVLLAVASFGFVIGIACLHKSSSLPAEDSLPVPRKTTATADLPAETLAASESHTGEVATQPKPKLSVTLHAKVSFQKAIKLLGKTVFRATAYPKIKVTVEGAAVKCAARFTVEALDSDDFIVERIEMDDLQIIPGKSCFTTKSISMDTYHYQSIAKWQIADTHVVPFQGNLKITNFQQKLELSPTETLPPLCKGCSLKCIRTVRVKCVNYHGSTIPSAMILQRLDEDGFEALRVELCRSKCEKWLITGNQLDFQVSGHDFATLEELQHKATDDEGHTWRLLPGKLD